MALGYDRDLYILAFDHRGSFQKNLFGVSGSPTPEERVKISDAKSVIFDGFLSAHKTGKLSKDAGVLVDEEFGGPLARKAKEMGLILAMPVEASGRDEFEFDYGAEYGQHIASFNPTFAKVLVRANPEGDKEMNDRQTKRLKELSDWLHANNRLFLFELLVPATKDQKAKAGGDTDRFDKEIRPALVLQSIAEFQKAGVEADVWKIEGIDDRADCIKVANQARSGGRDNVICVVLGRGAGEERVNHWLRTGSGVPGYRGFAIGRTLWWDALVGYRDKTMTREQAADLIGKNYLKAIDVYVGK